MYQPSGFDYPKLEFFDIRKNGIKYTASKFPTVEEYRDATYTLFWSRRKGIKRWLDKVYKSEEDAALCCWCPYSRKAQKILNQHGNFICHTEIVRRILIDLDSNLIILNDADRQKHVKHLWSDDNIMIGVH